MTKHKINLDQNSKKIGVLVKVLETATRSGIFVTMITTFGLANSMYNSTVNIKLTMDDLFL